LPKGRVFAGLLACLCGLTLAEDSLLQAVRTKLQGIRPFTVDFTQQVNIEGQKELTESGRIYIQDFHHLLWKYDSPSAKVFLLTANEYRFYQPEEKQLLIGRLQTGRDQSIWQILDTPQKNRKVRSDPKKRTITIRIDADETDLEFFLQLNRDNLPTRVVQTDEAGVTTIFSFSRYQVNASWDPNLFRLQVPPDTEIIDEREF